MLEILLHISSTDWRRLNLPRLTYQPAFVLRCILSLLILTGWASVPRSQETLAQRRQGLKDAAGFGCHAAHHQLREPPGPPEVEGFEVVAPPELTAEQDALVD